MDEQVTTWVHLLQDILKPPVGSSHTTSFLDTHQKRQKDDVVDGVIVHASGPKKKNEDNADGIIIHTHFPHNRTTVSVRSPKEKRMTVEEFNRLVAAGLTLGQILAVIIAENQGQPISTNVASCTGSMCKRGDLDSLILSGMVARLILIHEIALLVKAQSIQFNYSSPPTPPNGKRSIGEESIVWTDFASWIGEKFNGQGLNTDNNADHTSNISEHYNQKRADPVGELLFAAIIRIIAVSAPIQFDHSAPPKPPKGKREAGKAAPGIDFAALANGLNTTYVPHTFILAPIDRSTASTDIDNFLIASIGKTLCEDGDRTYFNGDEDRNNFESFCNGTAVTQPVGFHSSGGPETGTFHIPGPLPQGADLEKVVSSFCSQT